MTTLTNSFHHTSAMTKYTQEQLNQIRLKGRWNLTPAEISLVRRLHNKLCGSSTCTCGDMFGARRK